MRLTEEDRIFIKKVILKGYSAKRLIKEFPTKGWKKTALNDFLKHLRDTEHEASSGRLRTAHTDH